jgi:hypothetical protein
MKLLRSFSFAAALTVAAFFLTSRALGIGIPGIPGVPGANPQTLAINAASKQLTPWVHANQPILLDWNAVFPITGTLPGAPFAPISDAGKLAQIRQTLQTQLAHSSTGVINLPVGDYAIQVRSYCTDIHRHAGSRALLMGPLKGARATLLAAMYARASGRNLPFSNVQSLSWAMQAGLRYDQLSPQSRQLFDELIPDFRAQAAGNFAEQAQDEWNTLSRTIPGLPSMDSAIGSLGETGQTILTIRDAQSAIIANANNYDALSRILAPPNPGDSDQAGYPPPWSQVADGVYERVVTPGHFGATSELDIRVAGPAETAVPVTNVIGYPPNHKNWQPLTHESPTFAFGPISVAF